jgi:ATP-dependent DNA helicase PIF1
LEGYDSALEAFLSKQNELRPLRPGYSVPEYTKISDDLEALIQQQRVLHGNSDNATLNGDDEVYQIKADIQGKVVKPKQNAPQRPDANSHEDLVGKLNPQQKQIYDLFKNHIKEDLANVNPQPIRLFLTGGAGCGKTFLANRLVELINLSYYDENDPENTEYCIKMAPTGAAACLIDGVTIHNGCYLMVDQKKDSARRKHSDTDHQDRLSGKKLEVARNRYKKVKCILIDETSMINEEMLKMIARRCQEVSPNEKARAEYFGGFNMIFLGDPMQLNPIKGKPFYSKNDEVAFTLWNLFNFCELQANMRQSGDDDFKNLLNAVRVGEMSTEHTELLLSKLDRSSKLEGMFADEVATRIVPTKKQVEAHNAKVLKKFAKEFKEKIVSIVAVDNLIAESTSKIKGKLPDVKSVCPSNIDKTAGVPEEIKLCKGARVMLKVNISVREKLVNGSLGRVTNIGWQTFQHIKHSNQMVEYVEVKFDHIENPVKVYPKDVMFDATNDASIIERTQVPLVLAWAVTAHKLQGATVESAVVDLGPKLFAPGQAYVMLSRVRSLDNLILSDLDLSKLCRARNPHQFVNESALRELTRLRKLPKYRDKDHGAIGPFRIC